MDSTQKLLNKINKKDKIRILEVMKKILQRELQGIKLKNTNQYRVRIGNYRIKYSIKDKKIIIEEVRRRNEKTYKN